MKMISAIEDLIGPQFKALEHNPDGTVKKWGYAILVSGHLEQYRSTAADGEYCYNGNGPEKSVRAYMVNPTVGVGDATHVMVHDLAHCEDLLVEDAHKVDPYAKDVAHPLIMGVYARFSRSPHKYQHMIELIESWGAKDLFRQIHYLFEVRFVASEYIAISNFLASFAGIVAALRQEFNTADITPEMKLNINGWLRKMTKFKFVAYLIVMCDVQTLTLGTLAFSIDNSHYIDDVNLFISFAKSCIFRKGLLLNSS
jgi:hypothetical protein